VNKSRALLGALETAHAPRSAQKVRVKRKK